MIPPSCLWTAFRTCEIQGGAKYPSTADGLLAASEMGHRRSALEEDGPLSHGLDSDRDTRVVQIGLALRTLGSVAGYVEWSEPTLLLRLDYGDRYLESLGIKWRIRGMAQPVLYDPTNPACGSILEARTFSGLDVVQNNTG